MDLQPCLVTDFVEVPVFLVIQGEGEEVLIGIVLGNDLDTGAILGQLEKEHDPIAVIKRFTKYSKPVLVCLKNVQIAFHRQVFHFRKLTRVFMEADNSRISSDSAAPVAITAIYKRTSTLPVQSKNSQGFTLPQSALRNILALNIRTVA